MVDIESMVDVARHVIQRTLTPRHRSLIQLAPYDAASYIQWESYDAASKICQALPAVRP
jgi:hypothetical protein